VSTHPSNRSNGFAEGAFCADASTTPTNKSSASLNETMQYRKIIAECSHIILSLPCGEQKGTIRI
jgi:hypothetical protein